MIIESNPYACLGLMPGSSQADIKRRYRQLAKQYHPDRPDHAEGDAEKLRGFNEAYAFLSNATRKAAYDAQFAPVFYKAAYLPPRFSMRYQRQRQRLRMITGLALFLLISIVIFFSADSLHSLFAGIFPPASGAADAAPPSYDFIPARSQSTFDPQSSPKSDGGADTDSGENTDSGAASSPAAGQ
jgi:curved DNA-binding protein CbpA